MNFDLNEEQTLLKDSIERYLSNQYDFDHRREVAHSESGTDAKDWQNFAELGWLSIPFAEDAGGFGGGAVDTMVIMEQLGRGLVLEPYLETVLLFGKLLEATADSESPAIEYLEAVISGELTGALAYQERQSRYELADVNTRARKEGDNWLLSGEKTVVFNGAIADKFVVSARVSGGPGDRDGLGLFLVDGAAEGLKRTTFRMMDGRLVANIGLDDVVAEQMLASGEAGYAVLAAAIQNATLAVCAEAVGIMDRLREDTLEYAKTREQFGVYIGSFQALQHRLVDMFSACEQARSLLYRTVCSMDEGRDDVAANVHALKAMIGKAGKAVGAEAIQIHGGMGMTDELPVGHYVKRLLMINTLFGDRDYHLQRFVELSKPIETASLTAIVVDEHAA
ncbi:MAG: alkylation response protein AidB-like acyl-CoA dehydrogenase [Halieaceae bacterium]|jgi:alkylation response protein AidB-like acyl-CoA dehydrogenase